MPIGRNNIKENTIFNKTCTNQPLYDAVAQGNIDSTGPQLQRQGFELSLLSDHLSPQKDQHKHIPPSLPSSSPLLQLRILSPSFFRGNSF